ncbi:hypothetical protein DFQ28_006744 [Apophysomyces sp. BC1034]|nr:hypothetical protein DFQ30_002136 [Apophysomyces sp. BC1015]KAG0176866.1 hypothetical protein DFQ29_005538 [Apophysomyces sp. BC1021]KAG0187175.1 hypothetical protein DFQ28_006744 [Apophysomyces sp. BC1034]
MIQLDKEVIRCAKQVYNHLGFRDRICALNESLHIIPSELQKMQTLCTTSRAELASVVKLFLQWTPQPGVRKSLKELERRLDDALLVISSYDIDLELEETSCGSAPAKRSVATLDIEAKEHSKRPRTDRSYSDEMPDMSPPPLEPTTVEIEDVAGSNVLCNPPSLKECTDNVSWVILFEIARFFMLCEVRWQELGSEVLQKLLDVAIADPRQLFPAMAEWNDSQRGMAQSATSHSLLERCTEHVWSHMETSDTPGRLIHYSGVMALFTTKQPIIHLRPPRVGFSNRFFRKYGSHRFLELKLNMATHPSLIRARKAFFLKPFLLMDRIYKFLFVKDGTVVLFATEGPGLEPITIRQVINWHIPIEQNSSMTMGKYASRMALGYSNSIPTVVFEPHNIQYIDDVYASADRGDEGCMTDGCGIISCAAMRKLMGFQEEEGQTWCAVQGRIGGAKGIWIISPDMDFDSGEWIQIRASQNKFKTGVVYDPIQYTFDLVKKSICIYPSNLNTQFIQCLADGGVSESVFLELLDEYLWRLATVVTNNRNVKVLRDWVVRLGNVMRSRQALEESEKSEYKEHSTVDEDYLECRSNEGESSEIATAASADGYWRLSSYSGIPASLYESTVRMLDSGFDLSNPHVANKVTSIFRDAVRSVRTKYKIEVEQSCTVTCVPDPTGTLEPGEIFLQLSKRRKDEKSGIRAGQILGDAIVTRNPCGLKSDVQKVKAVDCPALRIYTDVAVFSIKGERSLASMLGGGDYDGDIIFCCWDPRIVDPFRSSPVPLEPVKIGAAFQKCTTTIREQVTKHSKEEEQERALQTCFVSVALPDGTLGLYENWRTVLTESTSFENEDVIYLAHMCAKLVDAPKQGLELKQAVLMRDRNDFSKVPHPEWFLDKRNRQRAKTLRAYEEVNKDAIVRERSLVTVMDHLYDKMVRETDAFTRFSKSMFVEEDVVFKDPDLSAPWMKMQEMAEKTGDDALRKDLAEIRCTVEKNYNTYVKDSRHLWQRRQKKMDSRFDPARQTESFLEDQSQFNTAFELEDYFAQQFHKLPTTYVSPFLNFDIRVNNGQMVQKIKASYAYLLTIQAEKYSKYCYIVAYDILRRMKADACTPKSHHVSESIAPSMYNALNLDRRWMRRLKETKSSDDCGTHVRIAHQLKPDEKTSG